MPALAWPCDLHARWPHTDKHFLWRAFHLPETQRKAHTKLQRCAKAGLQGPSTFETVTADRSAGDLPSILPSRHPSRREKSSGRRKEHADDRESQTSSLGRQFLHQNHLYQRPYSASYIPTCLGLQLCQEKQEYPVAFYAILSLVKLVISNQR